ncbi:TetR/AcrR family transcriptional regulator [Arcanobacterium phocisimile]|uniref:TetR/AcrR family transcriptional regulator n=1 Tax=Arcanobacterium phocisimile TaxID=1302235 RepID=A0ABX7IEZ7_9ACTO|nr:TetR/AcrR family transcriptional regulator [Arcanobacterium phocisimile]QRV01714.1 TetR/AcrR family transcriptional regulator [Arcanobacterium phocisimile]
MSSTSTNRTDPRYIRSSELLRNAILELSKHHRPDDISIAELTKVAGISRGTFYSHASTPAELLANVLIEELSPRFSRISSLVHDSTNTYLLRWRDIYIDLLIHVHNHRSIYKHIFIDKPESIALGYLTTYFRTVIQEYVLGFAAHNEEPPTPLWLTMATEQQVHNTIVIITSWLETDMQTSPERAMNTFMSLVPPWQLAKLSEDGRIYLRRTRTLHSMLSSSTEAK